ncbi:hypothetical protein EKO27_g5901 [Xylaria grammica]|uniref:Protein kinase domain-containing protein n=1 Tax=Xylaria grammica TaxID=363999 RepID=A0A439D456_9PEZI|nr:hypothetical protein EKO27_g5901 [Xylaria grammica]
MSGVELSLAIVGAVDIALRHGQRLMKLCEAFKHAEGELTERILRVEAGWLSTVKQLEFMQMVGGSMDEYHKQINEKIIEMLQSKLKIVISKLERVLKMPNRDSDTNSSEESNETVTPRRWKYALLKESTDEAVQELEAWRREADPSWYLLLKISNSQIDQALARDSNNRITLFPTTSTIRAVSETPTAMNCQEYSCHLTKKCGPQRLLLTQVECPPEAKTHTVKRDLRDLARKLSHDSPRTFGLLSCKGVIEQVDATAAGTQARVTFTVVFRTPADLLDPRSLRDHLISGIEGMALSDKFDIARQMATSVSYVHTFGFVHKDVRPETVIVFTDPRATSPPAAFLVGFGSSRKDEGKTYRVGDDNWEKNLYRHPSRQGVRPDEEYTMQHDIYSLGVGLLEVGLSKSFVGYDAEGIHPISLQGIGAPSNNKSPWQPDALKNHLVSLAADDLPRYMGRRYAAVVKTCLTCLDPDNTDFGDEQEFLDKDGVLVGVRYIEKVLSQLNAICV